MAPLSNPSTGPHLWPRNRHRRLMANHTLLNPGSRRRAGSWPRGQPPRSPHCDRAGSRLQPGCSVLTCRRPRGRSCQCAGDAYGRCLPIQRSGPPNRRCRCHPRSTTPRRMARNRSRARATGPVRPWSSISQACLAAHRAHPRHSATSGWLPRCTMRSGASTVPQHQHADGSSSESSTAADVGMGSAPFGLLRRAHNSSVGAEHAAVTGSRLQPLTTAGALVEVLAGALGHRLRRLHPA